MSHWRSASGSWSGARPARLELALAAARSAAVSRSTSSLAARPPLGILPMGRLRAAPTRADWRPAAAMKAGLLDLTVATPDLGVLLHHGAAGGLYGGLCRRRRRAVR